MAARTTIADLRQAADYLTARFREEPGRPTFEAIENPNGWVLRLQRKLRNLNVDADISPPLSKGELHEYMKAFARGLSWYELLPLQVADKAPKRKLVRP